MKRPHYLQCNTEEWQKARMRALVRDDFTCQHPGCEESRLRFLHVHHKKQRINGGGHELSNLITLCRVHHTQLHPFMAVDLPQEEKALDGWMDKEL